MDLTKIRIKRGYFVPMNSEDVSCYIIGTFKSRNTNCSREGKFGEEEGEV